jgi:hypothetical protein
MVAWIRIRMRIPNADLVADLGGLKRPEKGRKKRIQKADTGN